MSLKNKFRLFKLRLRINLIYFYFGFTNSLHFNQVSYNKMLDEVRPYVNKYYRIKYKLNLKEKICKNS